MANKICFVMQHAINRQIIFFMLKHSKDYGNRDNERYCDPPQKKIICEWRRLEKELEKLKKDKHFFIHFRMV
jgi:hypothetical protein